MTCIVGLVSAGKVYIGADSAGVCGLALSVRADRKVFTNGEFVFGFTTSFRMGQLLQHVFVPPKLHPDDDLSRFMVTQLVDGVRGCLKAGGFATTRDGGEVGGEFLVGVRGRLFRICSDYQVGEPGKPYDAVGCGESYALGALFANGHLEPEQRVSEALTCAEAFSAGVRGPFHIESL